MQYKIDKLRLPKNIRSYSVRSKVEEDLNIITGLSNFNFFVGENNSGKSRLIRAIASDEDPRFRPSFYPNELPELSTRLLHYLDSIGRPNWKEEAKGFFHDIEFPPLHQDFQNTKRKFFDILESYGNQTSSELRELIKLIRNSIEKYTSTEEFGAIVSRPWKKLYLPVLRGLRPVTEQNKGDDFYRSRTLKDYFKGKFSGEIYSGLSFYEDLRKLLLGDHSQRKAVRDFENFLSSELFGGESVTLIPREGSDVVWLRLGNSQDREIYNVGDGLQNLIILTFPLFKNRDQPHHVFVEEPELFLHPGMQRSLIKAMRKFDHNQYFITTHSNHFLDLTLEFDDISIYTLQHHKETSDGEDILSNFEITLVSSHDFRVLEMLGARSSSMFFTNCSIWVEGITDRRFLSHYLNLYIEKLKKEEDSVFFTPRQDLHFSFVEYSGGNITHWSFLDTISDPILVERLCSKSMLITDKDKGKEERHKKLKSKLGDQYYCLSCREIENLLTPDVLRKILISYGESEINIPSMAQENYHACPLGEYLDGILPKKLRKRAKYSAKSGTIIDKIEFCSRAVEQMPILEGESETSYEFDQLSTETKKLTKKIYEFIKHSNK